MPRADLTRLRWRLRGATQWPVFVVATVGEGVLLNALPIAGRGPGGLVGGLLLAMAFNLIVVAALAPLAGALVRRRRPDLPRTIATDYCGTVLLALLFANLLVAGVVHHAAVVREERARAASFVALSSYVHSRARAYLGRLPGMTTVRVEAGMYRTCVPARDPDRAFCVYVRTDRSPPAVKEDPERIPNALWRGD